MSSILYMVLVVSELAILKHAKYAFQHFSTRRRCNSTVVSFILTQVIHNHIQRLEPVNKSFTFRSALIPFENCPLAWFEVFDHKPV